jgi:Sec-independent protein translocase protein TatA
MEILGVGPSEFIFIVIIALIILGPKDMQKAGKTLGKWLRNIVTSDGWKIFQQTSRELRTLPNRLMRDANNEINQIGNNLNNATNLTGGRSYTPGTPLRSQPVGPIIPTPAATTPENKIEPSVSAETKENESDPDTNA